jgi:tetratricopeptide (TPR) repeat protein
MTDAVIKTMIRKGTKLTESEKKYLREMVRDYRQFPIETGNTQEARVRGADAHRRLADMSAIIGERKDAVSAYRTAIQRYQELAEEFPNVAEYREEAAICNFNLGFLLNELARHNEAEEAYRLAIELHDKLSKEFPAEPRHLRELVEEHNNLGGLLRDQQGPAKAEKTFRQAVALGEKLVKDFPEDSDNHIRLAASYHNLGNVVRDQGNPKAALSEYCKAIDLLVAIKNPSASAALFLRNAHWDRANSLGQLKRHAEAIKDWQRAIDLEVGADREHLRRFLAVAQMEEKLKSPGKPAGKLLYDAAGVFARAIGAAISTGEAGLQEQYTKRALDLLKKARFEGYFTDPRRIQEFKKDGNFDPLSKVAEYKKFVESLEAGKRAK